MLTVEYKNGIYLVKYNGFTTGVSTVEDVALLVKKLMN